MDHVGKYAGIKPVLRGIAWLELSAAEVALRDHALSPQGWS